MINGCSICNRLWDSAGGKIPARPGQIFLAFGWVECDCIRTKTSYVPNDTDISSSLKIGTITELKNVPKDYIIEWLSENDVAQNRWCCVAENICESKDRYYSSSFYRDELIKLINNDNQIGFYKIKPKDEHQKVLIIGNKSGVKSGALFLELESKFGLKKPISWTQKIVRKNKCYNCDDNTWQLIKQTDYLNQITCTTCLHRGDFIKNS